MKISYIFKKIKNMRYKEYVNHAKIVADKMNKSTLSVLFDMAKCALLYGSGYMDYFEFEFYLLNGKERKTYLTGKYNNDIVKRYNRKEDWHLLEDKGEFNKLFKEYLGREFLDLREATFKEFKEFIYNKDKIVCKPLDNCGGKGIEIIPIDKSIFKNEYNVLKLYNSIMKKEQFLLEEVIIQNKELSKLYSGSVNTLRVITFLDNTGTTRILNTILRIGNNGNVDNFSSGGMYTFVNESGIVYVPAIDEVGRVYYEHPKTHEKIVGFKVPDFDKVFAFVDKLSKRVPTIRYVGWDIVITENNICVIEGNEYPGVFQVKPSISGIKTGDLPKFKKYMDL